MARQGQRAVMVTTAKRKMSTTAQGLGHRHRIAVDGLFDALPAIGDVRNPCDWCGKPRHKDRTKNWDYNPKSTNPASGQLQGDHSGMSRSECISRGLPIPPPDRLLHGECNHMRGDGAHDWMAPTKTGAAVDHTQTLVMPWPW